MYRRLWVPGNGAYRLDVTIKPPGSALRQSGLPALRKALDKRFTGTTIAATVDTSHGLARQPSEGILDIAVLSTRQEHDNVALELPGRQSVELIASSKLDITG